MNPNSRSQNSLIRVSLLVTCLFVVTSLAFIPIHPVKELGGASSAATERKVAAIKSDGSGAKTVVAKGTSREIPNGAFVGAINGKAFVLNENNGNPSIEGLSTALPVFKSFGLSADRRTLLYTSLKDGIPSGELYIEDLRTDRLQKVTSNLVLSAAWSPSDSRRLCYTFSTGEDIGLAVTNIDSGNSETLVTSGVFADRIQWDQSGSNIHYLHTNESNEALELTANPLDCAQFQLGTLWTEQRGPQLAPAQTCIFGLLAERRNG